MGNIVAMGEMLVRLSTKNLMLFEQAQDFNVNYGGGEANVAISLARLGHNVKFVTKLPQNEIAQCAVNELYKNHVDVSDIIRGGDRMGTYYLETGSSVRASKVIYDRKYSSISMAKEDEFDYDKIFEGATWFHTSGITAGISAEGAKLTKRFVKEAAKRNIPVSVDINYRAKLWTMEEAAEVMQDIIRDANVIFAGPIDCIKILGCTSVTDDVKKSMEDKKTGEMVLQEMGEKYNADYVINSQRESISATHNIIAARIVNVAQKKTYYSNTYDVDCIVDRVGTGDAMAAGVLSVLADEYENYEYAIESGACACALKHTINGDYNIVSKKNIDELIKNGGGALIKR